MMTAATLRICCSRNSPCQTNPGGSLIRLLVLLLTFFVPYTQAYDVGDKVPEVISKQLKLDPKKISVVDFFASWCTSCEKEIPLLQAMPLNPKTAILIGVCTDEELADGLAFQKKLGITFAVTNDQQQQIVAAFNPLGMPAIYLIHQGQVKARFYGAMADIDKKIQQAINRIQNTTQVAQQ